MSFEAPPWGCLGDPQHSASLSCPPLGTTHLHKAPTAQAASSLHRLASSLSHVQPGTGGLCPESVRADWLKLQQPLWPSPAFGQSSSLPSSYLCPAWPLMPHPSAGLTGELTCGTRLQLHPLHQRPQQEPPSPSQSLPCLLRLAGGQSPELLTIIQVYLYETGSCHLVI